MYFCCPGLYKSYIYWGEPGSEAADTTEFSLYQGVHLCSTYEGRQGREFFSKSYTCYWWCIISWFTCISGFKEIWFKVAWLIVHVGFQQSRSRPHTSSSLAQQPAEEWGTQNDDEPNQSLRSQVQETESKKEFTFE